MTEDRTRILIILLVHAIHGEQWSRHWYNRIQAADDLDATWAEFQQDLQRNVAVISQAADEMRAIAERAGALLLTEFAKLLRTP